MISGGGFVISGHLDNVTTASCKAVAHMLSKMELSSMTPHPCILPGPRDPATGVGKGCAQMRKNLGGTYGRGNTHEITADHQTLHTWLEPTAVLSLASYRDLSCIGPL